MAQVINTNIASLNAQRNLSTSQSSMNQALQRLSSGLRINSAKDDAAGMGIADRMTSQIRGLNQAVRNANDGISLSQTAEGSLGEIGNNLQRIRELAIQASNASNSAADRASIQAEATQLTSEITRVAEQTQFNGLDLLNGKFTQQVFQVGANSGQTISIDKIADARSSALGSHAMTADGSITGSVTTAASGVPTNGVTAFTAADNFTITTPAGTTGAITYLANSGAKEIAAAIDSAAGGYGVKATAVNSTTIASLSVAGKVDFNLNGTAVTATMTDKSDLSNLVSAINGVQGSTGVTASFTTSGSKASITLSTTDGRNIALDTFAVTGGASTATDSVSFGGTTLAEGTAVSAVKTGTVSLSSSQGAMSTANASGQVFANAGTNSSTFLSVAALDLGSASGAQNAIAALDSAISQIDTSRGALGAYQNRLNSAVASMQTTSENLSASRSRIQDTDFAEETAALTRAQILQQAGTAMLAQANQLPNNVLSLLK